MDVNGKIIDTAVTNQKQNAGDYEQLINFEKAHTSGVYFIVLSNGSDKVSIRIVKN